MTASGSFTRFKASLSSALTLVALSNNPTDHLSHLPLKWCPGSFESEVQGLVTRRDIRQATLRLSNLSTVMSSDPTSGGALTITNTAIHTGGISTAAVATLLELVHTWASGASPTFQEKITPAIVSHTSPRQHTSNMAAKTALPAPTVDRKKVLKAVSFMSWAMAIHFFSYEFARSSNLSLFTSKTTGFASPGAFPLAMTFVSPLSFVLLKGYSKQLEIRGPRKAIRNTALFCAAALMLAGGGASVLDRSGGNGEVSAFSVRVPVLGMLSPSKMLVWSSFVFQNSYAHLLYNQHWSFILSVLSAEEGSTWFATIAGLSSVSSTVAGTVLGRIVNKIGLAGLLGIAGLSLIVSMALADVAYAISVENGFYPGEEMKNKKKQKSEKGLIRKTRDLFHRVPVLGALFCEVVSFQSLSTVLNVCFVSKLKDAISDDATRAAWTGQFYAMVSGASGLLQFLVLPLFTKRIDASLVWRIMPVIPVCCTLVTSVQMDPSLYLVAFSFFAAKVMDYSIRSVFYEMAYKPLDFDCRYFGKEVIGVFGNRLGKSGISLFLSGLTALFGNFGIQDLSRLTALASITWLTFARRLSALVSQEDEADGDVVKGGYTKKKRE